MQTLRALWKVLPTSAQRNANERLIESNSAALSQSDVDKLKQVLSRSKERTFEHFDLKTFVQRVKTLIDDNRLFLERILNNAETANLYKVSIVINILILLTVFPRATPRKLTNSHLTSKPPLRLIRGKSWICRTIYHKHRNVMQKCKYFYIHR